MYIKSIETLDTQNSSLSIVPQFDAPQFVLAKTPHLTIPTMAEVGASALNKNLPDQYAARIPHVDTIATSAVDVAVYVAFDAVWGAGVGVGKDASVGEEGGVRVCVVDERVSVDGRCTRWIDGTVSSNVIGIGDVDCLLVRRKGDAVWPAEAVGYNSNITRRRVEAVY